MSDMFNTALADGLSMLFDNFGERFYARPPTSTGNATIGPFTGLFSEVRAETVETETGFIRVQARTLTTSTNNAAIIQRGNGASIEDPQGVRWKIRSMASRDASSRTFELYREGKD